MSEVSNSDAGDKSVPDGLTAQDLRLGRKALKYMKVLIVVGIVACVAIASFVVANVPWDTRMPYDGKYDRSGSGIPLQIAMLPCLLVLLGLWRLGRKPDAHEMDAGSRVVTYFFGTVIVFGSVVGQWVMATSVLEAGGYIAG